RSRSKALNLTTYFLTAISFATTNHLQRPTTATVIQKNAAQSMTRPTSVTCSHPIATRDARKK
ncbi:MAG TPA: hypothetical protein VGI22_18315, partial [Xanthobacteraceae bacterium]